VTLLVILKEMTVVDVCLEFAIVAGDVDCCVGIDDVNVVGANGIKKPELMLLGINPYYI
jgi:hypothetical protein